jgi:ferric-dicitrate binding protein FerR (iron transport regulator)
LSFENRDLNRVIKSLERFYNIKIQFENPLIGMLKISGKLDLNQNQEEVFEYLAKVTDTKFEQIDEKYYKIK